MTKLTFSNKQRQTDCSYDIMENVILLV